MGVSSCLLVLCGFGLAYGLGLQRPFLGALPQDGQGQAFGLPGSGSMTLQGVGPACFGSVTAGTGTGGAIALAGGAAVLTAAWILTWPPGRPRAVTHPTPSLSLSDRQSFPMAFADHARDLEITSSPWKVHAP
ncbi:hypothetical protein ACIP4Q_28130 [Streptomyces massasporeus]